MTEQEIEKFISNLRESLLKAHTAGTRVCLQTKHDVDAANYGVGLQAIPDGHFWMGVTFTIKVGRPAEVEYQKDMAARHQLLADMNKGRDGV